MDPTSLQARHDAVFGNPDLLALVAARMTPTEKRVTLPLLSRAWQAAAVAAVRAERLAISDDDIEDDDFDDNDDDGDLYDPDYHFVPLWYIQSNWGRGSRFRRRAAVSAA
jgi:hypothetical protein